ncbi:histidine kinase [Streptomyces sp. YIM 121038]|uniref:sensor histidine kinase n=1 Tax=Streptomyces sp. YIM 121038 TaxID=2136401 RepID=UPI001110FA32|nr:histidine kinase [Streptomyces sp. YIM 121038]
MGILTLVCVVPTRGDPRPDWDPWLLAVAEPVPLVAYAYPGFVVARRRPGNRIGWLLLVSGFGGALDALGHAYAVYAIGRDLPAGILAAWVSNWAFALHFFPLYFLLLCFPDGALPSGRWRIVTWYTGVCGVWVPLSVALLLGTIDRDYFPNVRNPLGLLPLEAFYVPYEALLSSVQVAGPFVLCALSLLARYRRTNAKSRQQFKWVAFAALASLVMLAGAVLLQDPWISVAIDLILVTFSVSIAIAIVRHNLFDIDRLLSRSLLYLGMTAGVAGLYIGAVSLFALMSQRFITAKAPLLATGVVAVVLQPLRALLQRVVNRLVYGLREDPYAVLAGLDRRLETVLAPRQLLPEAVATIAKALRLPYVAVEVKRAAAYGAAGGRLAVHGAERPVALRLALVHQGEEIGTLAVAARAAEDGFSGADLRLLADVARHLAQAAAGVRLSLALLQEQERAVTARAEERRHLARDLHDSVGPVLSHAASAVETACAAVHTDPSRAADLVTGALVHIRQGSDDLRWIALGLRSPVDQLGLREAVLAYLDRVPVTVHTDMPDLLPPMPAAVEEAVYRILTEAVTDVLRHARAACCWVSLELSDGHLTLTVADDGQGPPGAARPSEGLASIRECAIAIGGMCEFRARSGGGRAYIARLPRSLPGAQLPATREASPLQPGPRHRDSDRAGGEP